MQVSVGFAAGGAATPTSTSSSPAGVGYSRTRSVTRSPRPANPASIRAGMASDPTWFSSRRPLVRLFRTCLCRISRLRGLQPACFVPSCPIGLVCCRAHCPGRPETWALAAGGVPVPPWV
ncbi:hypothetical protein BU26DRAFT_47056 [Trematosphaeria pertusa]|uniref:Uncharacterized protein n=1 Tax=Trematosphaeria pertusa TaxID=390896 RepID=A0A6A6I955_9PLEO|nr:uncharacterized protein BU26DRAFT_47056 [Trematosphaeria pertusa]KAF2246482.1 hypothetical protein BU26DRAFT_47056 [Trematosphaeria pertusa]